MNISVTLLTHAEITSIENDLKNHSYIADTPNKKKYHSIIDESIFYLLNDSLGFFMFNIDTTKRTYKLVSAEEQVSYPLYNYTISKFEFISMLNMPTYKPKRIVKELYDNKYLYLDNSLIN